MVITDRFSLVDEEVNEKLGQVVLVDNGWQFPGSVGD